jgi:hypothetical protein
MVALGTLEFVYGIFSVTLVVAGLSMVGLAVHAYLQTERQEMLYLSIGFSIVVAAAIATTFSAFLAGFENGLVLLTVNYVITSIGYLFIIYSVVGR